ncbi:MAG TPA: hypothetical protein VHX38_16725 [Pseudonocardiaceae bacterium]|nr:hypothetical protein [Pseudonocardiaceae bacterium]
MTAIVALGVTAALTASATAAPATPTGIAAPSATSPITYYYIVERDWVRMHTRPSITAPTRALARLYDESPTYQQQQPTSGGFTLITDQNNGATGWILSSYLEDRSCIGNDCS